MEFEAVDEGVIGKLLVPEGTEGVKVNEPIAELVQEGSSFGARPEGLAPQDDASKAQAGRRTFHRPRSPNPRPVPPEVRAERAPKDNTEEFPAGTELVTMTVREALRDAMAEEMRRDETCS